MNGPMQQVVKPRGIPLLSRHETVLALLIVLEVFLFQNLGRNFLSSGNVSNIFRHSVEIGLLALVMTPVILTGGIDLSVGSMMGLCAVVFGILVKQYQLPPGLAALAAVGLGALGGWLALTAYVVVLGGVMFLRWRSGRWRRINLWAR